MNPPPDVSKGRLVHRGGASFSTYDFYYNPQEVEVTSGAEWVRHRIPGVHHPRLQYAAGNGRQVSMELHLYAFDPLRGMVSPDVDTHISMLESLTYPDTSQDVLSNREPARMKLVLGDRGIVMNCVLTSVSTTYKMFDSDMNTVYATVQVSFEEDVVNATNHSAQARRGR